MGGRVMRVGGWADGSPRVRESACRARRWVWRGRRGVGIKANGVRQVRKSERKDKWTACRVFVGVEAGRVTDTVQGHSGISV